MAKPSAKVYFLLKVSKWIAFASKPKIMILKMQRLINIMYHAQYSVIEFHWTHVPNLQTEGVLMISLWMLWMCVGVRCLAFLMSSRRAGCICKAWHVLKQWLNIYFFSSFWSPPTCKVIYHRESPIITPSSNGYSKGKKMSQLFMCKQLFLLDQILIYLQKTEANFLKEKFPFVK